MKKEIKCLNNTWVDVFTVCNEEKIQYWNDRLEKWIDCPYKIKPVATNHPNVQVGNSIFRIPKTPEQDKGINIYYPFKKDTIYKTIGILMPIVSLVWNAKENRYIFSNYEDLSCFKTKSLSVDIKYLMEEKELIPGKDVETSESLSKETKELYCTEKLKLPELMKSLILEVEYYKEEETKENLKLEPGK